MCNEKPPENFQLAKDDSTVGVKRSLLVLAQDKHSGYVHCCYYFISSSHQPYVMVTMKGNHSKPDLVQNSVG